MKKYSGIIFFLPFIVATILALAGFLWYKNAILAPSSSSEQVQVLINKGASAESIGKALESAGVIKSSFAFKLYSQLNDKTKAIPPGEFFLPQNLSLEELVALLVKGPKEYWITIPEGLRREEIPSKFISTFNLKAEEAAVFRSEFLAESKGLEGYLFPDTYLFPPDISAQKVVSRLRETFYSKIGLDYENKAKALGLTLNQAVTLASLIERETLTKDERPIVAGIIFNRIEAGMPLQIDATVQYALADKRCRASIDCDWWEVPLRADLEIDSPYNTYLNIGIPPAPIANAGLTSLQAVINPEKSEFYYYIHDKDGNIRYASTLDEHNTNVSKYLR